MKRHRNSQKRLKVDEGIFFITTVTRDRYPFFKEAAFCEIFIEQLRLSKKHRDFRLYAFVIMPDHIHIIIHPGEKETISRVMHHLKRHTTLNINAMMEYHDIHSPEGEDGFPRPSKIFPRPSNNIDHQLRKHIPNELNGEAIEGEAIEGEAIEGEALEGEALGGEALGGEVCQPRLQDVHPRFAWQSSFHDHLIRNESDFNNHLYYLWKNPELDGLVNKFESYPYSSFGRYQELIDEFKQFEGGVGIPRP
jgi:REP element-mobilizing transposase RayT